MSASAAVVRAQAKINLSLCVGDRDPTGYHDIETVFLRIELHDVVTLRVGGDDRRIECHGADVGPPEQNLAFRAAEAFAAASGWPDGFKIDLEKRIPVGGGLGGGSADAGAVLRALNALAPSPVSAERLLEIGAVLGADVPFMTSEMVMALGRGRGHLLRELTALPSRRVLLAVPPFGIETRDAYGWLDEDRSGGHTVPPCTVDADRLDSWERAREWPGNDLQAPVVSRHHEIGKLLDQLAANKLILSRMSGSGSSVFAVYEGEVRLPRISGGLLYPTQTATRVAGVEPLRT